jgi:hypothetical protein
MLDLALLGSVLALAAAGAPHCVAMCAAPCALAAGSQRPQQLGFHVARVASYAALGGVAAASVGALARWAPQAEALRPLWTLLHIAALALGLWWLLRGQTLARDTQRGLWVGVASPAAGGSLRSWHGSGRGVARGVATGAAWAAWPCGLLHGALAVAALASSPPAGALLMAAFAVATSPALAAGPWALRRLGDRGRRRAVRLAGALLVASSGWALTHGLWVRFLAWCTSV